MEPKVFDTRGGGGDLLEESESQNFESRFATTPFDDDDEDERDGFVFDLVFVLNLGEGERLGGVRLKPLRKVAG